MGLRAGPTADPREAIAQGALTIYEATLEHQDVLVKVDILTRRSVRSAWQLIAWG